MNEELKRIKQLAGISEAEIHDFRMARKNKELATKQKEQLARAQYAYFNDAAYLLSSSMEYIDEAYNLIKDAEEETESNFSDKKDELLRLANEIGKFIEVLSRIPKQ